ncbi:hypothetical protein [Gemmata sp.]|uniref:hypothetical protein n=1 Tax=Gemmata sp. TaxID=1914242 RepID=UPI003F700BC3
MTSSDPTRPVDDPTGARLPTYLFAPLRRWPVTLACAVVAVAATFAVSEPYARPPGELESLEARHRVALNAAAESRRELAGLARRQSGAALARLRLEDEQAQLESEAAVLKGRLGVTGRGAGLQVAGGQDPPHLVTDFRRYNLRSRHPELGPEVVR